MTEKRPQPTFRRSFTAFGYSIEMRLDGGNVVVDKIIASVCRRPNLKGLVSETPGVPLDEKGMP